MGVFVHPNLGPLHLGRPKISTRTRDTYAKAMLIDDFLASNLPSDVLNLTIDKTSGITKYGMMLNDVEGDCTCAAPGHMIQTWTALNGSEVTVPDSAIQTAYEAVGGYVPGDPSTDRGAQIVDALNYFRDKGIGGYQISAHGEVILTQLRIMQALYVFDCVDMGIQLPLSAQGQVGGYWDFTTPDASGLDAPGTWGGHSALIAYADPYKVKIVTWGALQDASWRWLEYYADEAHAAIFPGRNSLVPTDQLVADLSAVGK